MTKEELSAIIPNPNNPRTITGSNLEKLINSIQQNPKMMALRPIIIDENNTVIGGNQRLLALKALQLEEIPDNWIKKASDLTDAEKQRFIIADNQNFGEWDFELLEMHFDKTELIGWGVDFPALEFEITKPEEEQKTSEKQAPDICTCPHCGEEFILT